MSRTPRLLIALAWAVATAAWIPVTPLSAQESLTRITGGELACRLPVWHPDGERVAFVCTLKRGNLELPLAAIARADVPGPDPENVEPLLQLQFHGVRALDWTPAGDRLVAVVEENEATGNAAEPLSATGRWVWIFAGTPEVQGEGDAQRSVGRRLLPEPYHAWGIRFHPSGAALEFWGMSEDRDPLHWRLDVPTMQVQSGPVGPDYGGEVYARDRMILGAQGGLMMVDGTSPEPTIIRPAPAYDIDFVSGYDLTLDGRLLVFAKNDELILRDTQSGEEVAVATPGLKKPENPRFSRDGRRIAFDARLDRTDVSQGPAELARSIYVVSTPGR